MLAGVSMVFVGDMVGAVWSPVWSTMAYFVVLIVVLSIRPQGLFGKQTARVA
jgi:branched-subunit amino acid ABC-type transport system permease component